jgi:hypothetical protein
MKFAVSALVATMVFAAIPASAQMMAPTTKQCKMGYKKSYMKSMDWSKATFTKACNDKMMMMKKDKMMKDKM